MKTKLYLAALSFALAFLAPKANAQTLIQYWDFNQTPPAGGAGGDSLGNVTNPLTANYTAPSIAPDSGHIIYSVPNIDFGGLGVHDGILDNGSQGTGIYDNSMINDTGGTAAGNLYVRTRNPSDSAEFLIYIPTTGYKNIKFDCAISASSTKGPNYGIFSYSTNGGTSWNNLTTAMDTFNIGGVYRPDTLQLQNPVTAVSGWYPVQLNFSSDASVNNNANFVLCIRMAGANSNEQTSGNSRWDNFAFWGTSVSAGVNGISEAEAAGYSIYPNPATNFVNVVSRYTGDKIVTVYNAIGQVVCVAQNHDIETAINTSSLTTGTYIVEIKEVSTGNKYTQKIVKE